MSLSATVNVVAAFLVSFTLPYLLNAPYAALGAGVGWIFGSFALLATIFSILYVPETKGRNLEELDYCFEQRVSAWRFSQIASIGAARELHQLELAKVSSFDRKASRDMDKEDGSPVHLA